MIEADLVYAEIVGYRPLRLDLYLPAGEGPWPLVVWVHGGAWRIGWLCGNAARFRLDVGRLAVWGESAGGTLAALAALAAGGPRVHAVVDWFGASDLSAVDSGKVYDLATQPLGGVRSPEQAVQASPVEHAHPGAPPFLLMHGTDDQAVPYSQSERLAAALHAHGARCDLHPVPGADHVFQGAPDVAALIEASLDLLDDVLKPAQDVASFVSTT